MSGGVPIAVLASGKGSNFEAIAQAIDEGRLSARITAVVSNKKDALVLKKAQERGIKAICIPSVGKKSAEHEREVLEALKTDPPRFIVLAGYMKILGSRFLEEFKSQEGYSRVVNVHPALLPSFPGVDSYKQAYEYGCKVSGVTVHLVDEKTDHGPICAQEAFAISDCTSAEEVQARGIKIEHRLYPQTLNWILKEEFKVIAREGGRLCVCTS